MKHWPLFYIFSISHSLNLLLLVFGLSVLCCRLFFYQISQNMTRDQPFCLIYPLIRWFTTQLDQNHLWKTMFLQWTLLVAVLYEFFCFVLWNKLFIYYLLASIQIANGLVRWVLSTMHHARTEFHPLSKL